MLYIWHGENIFGGEICLVKMFGQKLYFVENNFFSIQIFLINIKYH
jgi:hypothetical protein